MNRVELHHGDCLEVLRAMPDSSVDSIVTDPPYGLSFMGKRWDYDVPSVEIWAECLRVLKPGGHLLAFAGTRTQHRMAVRIEDAGFEIRDMIAWVYGSGFPKSMDVSKAIDKSRDDSADILRVTVFMADAADRAGITRADVDAHMGTSDMGGWWLSRLQHRCQCPRWDQWLQIKALLGLSDEMDAEVWRLNGRKGQPGEAWQTAEVVAVDVRMNEASGIVSAGRDERVEVERQIKAANSDAARQWQGWGTALKPALEPITVARKPLAGTVAANVLAHGTGALNIDWCRVAADDGENRARPPRTPNEILGGGKGTNLTASEHNTAGRWPANLIHDGSEPADLLGEAARFFYCAKASKRDRDEGLDAFEVKAAKSYEGGRIVSADHPETAMGGESVRANIHPTVKPTDLMAYLVRLVTPPGGLVLDPFMGSGSTGKAALREGFRFVGIEREAQYLEIARARIEAERTKPQPDLFSAALIGAETEPGEAA